MVCELPVGRNVTGPKVLPVTTRTVVAVLVGLGSALPLAGLTWAALAARARITVLQHQRSRLQEIEDEPGDVIEAVAQDEGIPVGGLGLLLAAPQIIEEAVLRQFKGPILLAGAGLIVGAVGGIWSLYLPGV
jgi:hypothetical protein